MILLYLKDQYVRATGHMPPASVTRDPTAMPPPWFLIRRHIAQQWGIAPWDVDAPELADEVGRWDEYASLEAQYAPPTTAPGR